MVVVDNVPKAEEVETGPSPASAATKTNESKEPELIVEN